MPGPSNAKPAPQASADKPPPEGFSLPKFLMNLKGAGFTVRYLGIAGVLFGLYFFPWEAVGFSNALFQGYLSAYARLAGFFIRIFDPSVLVHETTISGRYAVRIVQNCDAIEVKILFLGAVLAFPGSVQRRLISALLGVLAIVAVNVLRLTCLYFIGVYFPTWFEPMHLEVWPLILVAFATLDFLLWARWIAQPGSSTVNGSPTPA